MLKCSVNNLDEGIAGDNVLHLSGYDVSMDDLKNFRQRGSKTPGHPEVNQPMVLTLNSKGQVYILVKNGNGGRHTPLNLTNLVSIVLLMPSMDWLFLMEGVSRTSLQVT